MRERQEEEEAEGDELPKPFSLSGCALDYVVYAEQGGWHWTLAAHDINHFSLEALSKQRDGDGDDDDFQNGGYQNSLVHVVAHPNGHRLLYLSPLLCHSLLSVSLSLSACLNLFVRSHDHALRRFVLMPCAVQMFTQRAADADASDEMVPILSSQKRICLSPSESESLMCTQTSVMWQLSGERSLPI